MTKPNLRRTQDFQTAIDRYHELAHQNPYDTKVLTSLAWSYERAGEYPQAVQQFKQAIGIDQNQPDAYFGLGLALLGNNQISDAIEALEQAHRLAAQSDDLSYMVTLQHQVDVLLRLYRPA